MCNLVKFRRNYFFRLCGFYISSFKHASFGFDMCLHIINSAKQNVTMPFKINDQGNHALDYSYAKSHNHNHDNLKND